MSDSPEQFPTSVGLSNADFDVSPATVQRLVENEQNERLNSQRRFLANVISEGHPRYFEIDKYDSRDSMDTKVLIGPASVFDKRGRRHSEYARVIISRDNFSDNDRTLFTDDIVFDPILLGKGVAWNESIAHTNAKGRWSCSPNHGPKVLRQKDDSDRRLGPAAVTLHVGSAYETQPRVFEPLRSARVDRLAFYMGMMTSFHEVPHNKLKLFFH